MDLCEVLESFSGIDTHGTRGTKIELPHEIATAYERYGMVKILGEVQSPMAFETAKAAKKGKESPEDKLPKKVKK